MQSGSVELVKNLILFFSYRSVRLSLDAMSYIRIFPIFSENFFFTHLYQAWMKCTLSSLISIITETYRQLTCFPWRVKNGRKQNVKCVTGRAGWWRKLTESAAAELLLVLPLLIFPPFLLIGILSMISHFLYLLYTINTFYTFYTFYRQTIAVCRVRILGSLFRPVMFQ